MNTTRADVIAEVVEMHSQLQCQIVARKALENQVARLRAEMASLDDRARGNVLLVNTMCFHIVVWTFVAAMIGIIATLLLR